jgi:Zn-dependent protease
VGRRPDLEPCRGDRVALLCALIAHVLSHALVAKARDLPVRSITLFALGGVVRIEKEAVDPTTEFVMGIIGSITSAVSALPV